MSNEKKWEIGFEDGSGRGEDGEGCYITSGYEDDGKIPYVIVSGGKDDWGCAIGIKEKKHANRIVACVNFLADHPDLDKVEVVSKDEIAQLRQQRDALASALSYYVSICGNTGASFSRESAQEGYALGTAALAKVTP